MGPATRSAHPRRHAPVRPVAALATAAVLCLPAAALADAFRGFDWNTLANGDERSVLNYGVDAAAAGQGLPQGQTWLQHLGAAAVLWNAANTGWTLRPTNPGQPNQGAVNADTQIRLVIANHNAGGGAFLDGVFDVARPATVCDQASWPARGRTGQALLCFDPTPLSNVAVGVGVNWALQGANALDPVGVLVHELSHAMRMTHPGRGAANRTDPINPGDHGAVLTALDIAEARAAVAAGNRNVQAAAGAVGAAGGNLAVAFPIVDETGLPLGADLSVAFGPGAYAGGVLLRPLHGAQFPGPVFGGQGPVFMGLEIGLQDSPAPAADIEVTLSYLDSLFTDSEWFGPLATVDESRLGLFQFIGDTGGEGHWSLLRVEALSRDTGANTVRFSVPASAFSQGQAILGLAQVSAPGTLALLLAASAAGLARRRLAPGRRVPSA